MRNSGIGRRVVPYKGFVGTRSYARDTLMVVGRVELVVV